jgi:hypothetical protein
MTQASDRYRFQLCGGAATATFPNTSLPLRLGGGDFLDFLPDILANLASE